jgi:TatD DNase family protein
LKLIDTHAHVNFRAFKEDGDEVLKRALDAEIGVVNVGSQLSTSKRAVEMAHKNEQVWAAVGIHPLHLQEQTLEYRDDKELEPVEIKTRGEEFDFQAYLELAKDEKTVAIGEVGLDYHHFSENDDKEKLIASQKETFILAIRLANEVEKPIMIHCWDAYDDLFAILKDHPVKKSGVVHSFIGGYKTARKFMDLGFYIGMNGVITYADSFDRLVKETPLEKIVVETDCPYLAPGRFKGERNEPVYVKLVAERIAKIKDISFEEVAKQTTENAKKLLNI